MGGNCVTLEAETKEHCRSLPQNQSNELQSLLSALKMIQCQDGLLASQILVTTFVVN